jgi:multidrug efflux pump subunit AcrA (membrane-fusion protein)
MKFTPSQFSFHLAVILFLLTSNYVNAAKKNSDSNETAKNSVKSSVAKKVDYKTIKPERKDIRITLTLKGYFEDPEAFPFSVDTTTWSELKVLSPPTHGKYIKKGSSLLTLDLEKIEKKINDLKHEISISDLNIQILKNEQKRDESLAKIDLSKLNRTEKNLIEDMEHFKNVELPFEKKSTIVELKRYEENLSYAMEELNQLKKMYEADDLTEETEEIILQRTQNEVNRMKFSLEGAKIRKDKRLKLEIPRSEVEKMDEANKKKLSLQTDRIIKPTELIKKKLELKKIEEQKKQLTVNKKRLENDLKKMKVLSPITGTVIIGTFDLGKWSGSKIFETKLNKGGLLKPHEEFVTICPIQKSQARIKIPEKSLGEIEQIKEGKIISGLNPDKKLSARITKIGKIPVTPEHYDAVVQFDIPKGQKIPHPGTTCSLKVVTYEKKDAITLPQASVFKEDHDPDQKYVYILSPKGKPIKKIIETGKSFGTSIEVLNGIHPSSKILKEKPEA